MEVDILTICDFAQFKIGKLHIAGAMTHIYAADVPAIHKQFYIVALLRFAEDEQGLKRVGVEMIDTNEEKLFFLEVEINVELDLEDSFYCCTITCPVYKLMFPKFGEYLIRIFVDGYHSKSLPVTLAKVKQHLQ